MHVMRDTEAWLSWLEHTVHIREVTGSSPVASTNIKTLLNSRVSGVGGEEEIRTLEPLLTVTRFPVARPRPN